MFSRLYIHVPFCVAKCHYCAFISNTPNSMELEEYPELLIRELGLRAAGGCPVASIYFGGGTPSLLRPEQIALLLAHIRQQIGIATDAEITMEMNPGTVDRRSLEEFRRAGVNRISLGVQSFDDSNLACLGRIHTAQQSRRAFFDAREAGFNNISIDLINSLPGQSLEQWHFELQQAVELMPEHISVYGLTVEEGTPFSRIYDANSPDLPDEDLSADMFELADLILTKSGYEHYEIANYARQGYRSQHNSGYWQRDGYLGLGVAAHSFLLEGNGIRFSNPGSLEEYSRDVLSGYVVRVGERCLTMDDAMAEYMFLGLRLVDGVSPDDFERVFGRSFEAVYGTVINRFVVLGLMTRNERGLTLTQRGMLLSNQVFGEFLK